MGQARMPPNVRIGMKAPFRWLGEAWRDLWRAPAPFLFYGAIITIISVLLSWWLYVSNLNFWVLVLTAGYVFVAPILAMGCYEGGHILEQGQRPALRRLLLVRAAFRQDVCGMDDARHRLGRQGPDALGSLAIAERGQRPIDQTRHQRLLHRLQILQVYAYTQNLSH